MKDIVLFQLKVHPASLYDDAGMVVFKEMVANALTSPPVKWAVKNKCKIKSTIYNDPAIDTQDVVYYAGLTEQQQVEFALRF